MSLNRSSYLLGIGWLLLVRIASPLSHAQTVPETHTFLLSVHHEVGGFVEGLTPEELRLKKLPAAIKSVTLDKGPRRIVLLIDVSASMKNNWDDLQSLCKHFISVLGRDDWLSVYYFATSYKLLLPFTVDHQRAIQQIQELPRPDTDLAKSLVGRKTYTGTILKEMTEETSRFQNGDSFVLVSHGASKEQFKTVRHSFIRRLMRLFALYTPMYIKQYDDFSRTPVPVFYPSISNVRRLAQRSGGAVAHSWSYDGTMSQEGMNQTAQSIYSIIRNVYRVEIETQQTIKKPKKIELQLINEKGKKRKGVILTYPRYLLPSNP